MIHYHGTPITPRRILHQLHGKHFCVSFAAPNDVKVCHEIGQSVMLDNGAFSYWKRTHGAPLDWKAYYRWCSEWLQFHTTWAVIPDVIDGKESDNDHLIAGWWLEMKSFRQAAPVWHLHESFERLIRLTRTHERVCFGSSGEYAVVGSTLWNNRVNEAFNLICKGSGRPPCWIHMLRGMALSGSIYPFASVDSTDVARNHESLPGAALQMATRWDAIQNPANWLQQPILQELISMEVK